MKKVFLILLCIAALFIACDRKPAVEGITEQEALLISYKTYGLMAPDGDIVIAFNDDIIPSNKIGERLKEDVFSFRPRIDGEVYWQDTRTLVLKPSQTLPLKTEFKGRADIEKIVPSRLRHGISHIPIDFTVAGLSMISSELNFELIDESNPREVHLKGKLVFNIDVSLADIKEAISFSETASDYLRTVRSIPIELEQRNDKREIYVTSGKIQRPDNERFFVLKIDSKKLELESDIVRQLYIPSFTDFAIIEIEPRQTRDANSVVIRFSDLLDEDRDYDGFVNIEPHIDFRMSVAGNSLTLRGNFEYGDNYSITVREGLRNVWGIPVKTAFTTNISFEDMEPAMEFMQSGMFLPSTNKEKINIRTVNIRSVQLTVKQVFQNNLTYFMQDNSIASGRRSSYRYWNYYRVGKEVHTEKIEIGDSRNQWLQSELDLSKFLKNHDKGLFIIELSVDREDMIYEFPADWQRWEIHQFMWGRGFIAKPVIVSDLGIMAKKASDKYHIFVNNVINTSPEASVEVRLISFENQTLASGRTGSDGKVVFDRPKDDAFIITAEKDGQRSALKFDDLVLSTSLYDVGGVARSREGLKAFIYPERGVYRPGDSIFVSAIVRNNDNTFPDNHPVLAKIYDARGRLFTEILSKEAKDGLYAFKFKTNDNSPTGNWRFELNIGDSRFSEIIKVETIVPYQLRVSIEPSKRRLTKSDRFISAKIESQYLFGAPAAGHKLEAKFILQPFNLKFDRFAKFNFINEAMHFRPIESNLMEAQLNAEGKHDFNWTIPVVERAPSALRVRIEADVFEKGGRRIPDFANVEYALYDVFVGVQKPDAWYVPTGNELKTFVVAVNPDGVPVQGRNLNYRVYHNSYSWWYDFDNHDEAKRHFKTDNQTRMIASGSFQSGSTPVSFDFIPQDYGKLFVEVQDGATGHTAGYFINAYAWGSTGEMPKDAEMLAVTTDREKYSPGDTVNIFVQTPPEGRLLLSLEKSNQVLETRWITLRGHETVIPIVVTDKMMPNVYAVLTVLQPHSQTQNDRPIRMYGIAPIMVEDKSTKLEFDLKAPSQIKPESEFEIEVQTKDGRPAQFTIAVVDEGILNITRFQTPDPWAYFFRKEALGVLSSDLYSQIIGAQWGSIFKSFSIGGDYAAFMLEGEDKPQVKRFRPVAMFEGPINTDRRGNAKVKFTMPNYMGSVRVMAVAVRGGSYGNAEKDVAVKSELMVLPYLPRVLAPNDKLKMPVTVFANEDRIRNVKVTVETEGPVNLIGDRTIDLQFSGVGDRDAYFDIEVLPRIGPAKIKVTAQGSGYRAYQEIEIMARASSPPIFRSIDRIANSGVNTAITIPKSGVEGANKASLSISRVQKLSMNHRLRWLLRYPYGCLEQTVSAVFPQLYIREIVEMDKDSQKEIDKRVNASIARMRRFQTSEGGLSYWPNQSSISPWSTNYAMHFLVEAKKKGYHVPDDLLNSLIRYQRQQSRAASGDFLERAYRVYVLALSDNADMGAMNLLRQNSLEQMPSTARWYLAAAYNLAGQQRIANQIIERAGISVPDNVQTGGNFGSPRRDKAIILEMMTMTGKTDEAMKLYSELADIINSDVWLSTQETGYCLLAMGKFVSKLQQSGKIEGSVKLPDGQTVRFSSDKAVWEMELLDGFGEELVINVTSRDPLFASVNWEGIPQEGQVPTEGRNLGLQVAWLDDLGNAIDVSSISQGTSFWGVVRVANTQKTSIENIAVVQMLPSGWEIENVRLHGESAPEWTQRLNTGYEEYMDIRDDRIIWFFDFNRWNEQCDFVFKVNAVTPGQFYLPPSRVEAMYDRNYYANQAGKPVVVRSQ